MLKSTSRFSLQDEVRISSYEEIGRATYMHLCRSTERCLQWDKKYQKIGADGLPDRTLLLSNVRQERPPRHQEDTSMWITTAFIALLVESALKKHFVGGVMVCTYASVH